MSACLKSYSALYGIRTPGLLVRSQTLYPAELTAHTEREGFEPSIRSPVYSLSRGAPSASRSSLLAITEPIIDRRFDSVKRFFQLFSDGGGGIRTHGTREDSTVFKTASLNRSDTPPENNPNYKGVFSACQQKSSGSVCFNYFPIGAIGPSTQENSTKVSNVPFILLLIFSSWVMIVRMCLLRSTACRRSPMIAIERS